LPCCRCLFEIDSTPADKLQLLTHGFQESELASAFGGIDAGKAGCFDADAAKLIRGKLVKKRGSVDAFTHFLRLRFLLRPLSYARDVEALQARSKGEQWNLEELREFLEQQGPRAAAGASGGRSVLACVTAESGEGKSTLSAALVGASRQLVHAYHFCKHNDARRQDPVLIAKALAYQLAEQFPAFRVPPLPPPPPPRVSVRTCTPLPRSGHTDKCVHE
jgi:hypothetical protein